MKDLSTRFQFNLSSSQLDRALNPPNDNTVDVLHGVPVSDPFRPLENMDAPETTAWLRRQQAQFTDFISSQNTSIKNVTDFLTDAWNYDSEGLPSRYGQKYFRTFHKALAAQNVVQSADSAEGPWETILDPNAMSQNGLVALKNWVPSKDGTRIAYTTSENGSDEETVRIYDVSTGRDLPDVIEKARFTGILWDKDSHDAFQYNYPAHDETKRNLVKHHVIGTAAEQDTVVYDAGLNESFVSPSRLRTSKYDWIEIGIGTEKNEGLLFRPFGSQEPFQEIVAPKQYKLSPVTELEDGSVLAVTTKDSPRGRLIKFDPYNPSPENWQTIVPEHAQDILGSAMLHKGKLFVDYTRDTADATSIFTPEGQHLYDMPLPIQSVASYARINPEDDVFTLKISGFKSAGDTYTYDVATNSITFKEKGSAKIDLNECIVERLHATSKDGTKVPMTVIRHPDTPLDGTAAVKLYGYGGFDVPLTPGFSTVNAQFVKEGGIYVQANLRGGGEFGSDWYDGGRLHNKQNVFDDFIACAEHLIGNNYTSPARLIINGGSNGGLLTSATMVQRPELFGAVITEVPVTDMFRYHLPTYGAFWKSDYGDPDIKADFNISAAYSPLHNVQAGAKYPPHLIMTADHDDRVVPWHAFKLAATLQAKSDPANLTLLRVEMNAGHGAGKPLAKIVQEEAEAFAFIEKAIGPVNPVAYKAHLAAKGKPRPSGPSLEA